MIAHTSFTTFAIPISLNILYTAEPVAGTDREAVAWTIWRSSAPSENVLESAVPLFYWITKHMKK